MSIWSLIQLAFNIFCLLALWVMWTKLRRPPQDDPRLSRGLQLLQSKISVLEDLSDKTDHQVDQLATLMERKCREVQKKVEEAGQQIQRVDHSIERSLEVASIFEDRIPHQEIIERQRTRNYVQAAQWAHQGRSAEEIAESLGLPLGEVEMIAKVNRERLMFSAEDLPAWAQGSAQESAAPSEVDFQIPGHDFSPAPEPHHDDVGRDLTRVFVPETSRPQSLQKLGQEFRKACEEVEEHRQQAQVESHAEKVIQQLGTGAVQAFKKISTEAFEKVERIKQDISVAVPKNSAASKNSATSSAVSSKKATTVETPRMVTAVSSIDQQDREKKRHKQVPMAKIKTIQFPRIDMSDNLG